MHLLGHFLKMSQKLNSLEAPLQNALIAIHLLGHMKNAENTSFIGMKTRDYVRTCHVRRPRPMNDVEVIRTTIDLMGLSKSAMTVRMASLRTWTRLLHEQSVKTQPDTQGGARI